MPKGVKKENLPTKVCVTCNRPFTWRKKWEKVWDEVTTCSKSCNRKRRQEKQAHNMTMKMGDYHDQERKATTNNNGDKQLIISHIGNEENELKSEDEQSEVDIGALLDGLDAISIASDTQSDGNTNDDSKNKETDTINDRQAKIKLLRKAEKKRKKQERRAQREGRGDPTAGQKQCDMCEKNVDLLIRCTYDESLEWKMVCGKCWKIASGGVVDGDASHPFYKYGGLWKNRRRK
jgi:hypothetical protein